MSKNSLTEIHIKNGQQGIVDLHQREGFKQVSIGVINENGEGVQSIWVYIPDNSDVSCDTVIKII